MRVGDNKPFGGVAAPEIRSGADHRTRLVEPSSRRLKSCRW